MSIKNHATKGTAPTKGRRKNGSNVARKNQYEPEPGDPMYLDNEVPSVEKPRRRYGVGITERSLRVKYWKYLKKRELRKADKTLRGAALEKAVEDAYAEQRRRDGGKEELKFFDVTQPVSRSRRPCETNADVELAAMRWLAPVRWLTEGMKEKTNRRGFAGEKTLILSIFLQMAFGRDRPEFSRTYDSFQESRPLRAWAHDYPVTTLAKPSAYQGFHKMLEAIEPGEIVVAVNTEAIKRLAQKFNKRPWPSKRGKSDPLLIGEVGIIDGTGIPAHVQELFPRDDEEEDLLHGVGREKVRYIVHKDSDGSITKVSVGYSSVTLGDMASTTIYGTVVEAGIASSERKGLMRLLKIIFEIWPDCPMNTIVGDGLFHDDKTFAHELVFNYGIQPIFPRGEKPFAKDLPHVATEGVPHCACGEMTLEAQELFTAEKRAEKGIPRGQEAGLDGRLRWACKNGCKGVTTRPFDDPRLYTFYPRQGFSKRAIERRVFMLRRNAIESIFASLKNMVLGNDKFNCPQWARDRGMEWLLGAGSLALTARRLVHELGYYDEAFEEAEKLGLLQPASLKNPAPGPTKAQLKDARDDRKRWLKENEPIAAPRGYEDFFPDFDSVEDEIDSLPGTRPLAA